MLKIGEFISIATQLSIQACELIKEASLNKKLGKYLKGIDDPVTQADYHVQTMIINGFRRFFPKLRIIGQETVDYQGQVKINYESFVLDFFPSNLSFKELSAPLDQLCVWIDPIDCTKGFISGQMDYVTNLIGMSRNNQAYVGIIGVPYLKKEQKTEYQPSITIGVSQTHEAYRYEIRHQTWSLLQLPNLHKPLIITNTKGRVCQKFIQIQNFIQAKSEFAEGSGRKIMMIINGEVDIWVYLSSFTSKWDTCAGEAVIKALKGCFLTPKGEEIQYDPYNEDYKNSSGLICCLNQQLFENVLQFLNASTKK